MKSRMLIVALIAASFASIPARADSADCTVFQHRDYRGSYWHLSRGDILAGVNDPDPGVGVNVTIYWRPDWNDQISSFRVAPGCTITLWEHINQTGKPPRGYGAQFRTYKSYKYIGGSWNDKASMVTCGCR